MPTTEIMAAIPMAIPNADKKARVGRALMPVPPRRSTSLRRSRERWSRRAILGHLTSQLSLVVKDLIKGPIFKERIN